MTAGMGWIAIAIVIFSRWTPHGILLGGLLFGGVTAFGLRMQMVGIAGMSYLLYFWAMLPYIVTLVALTVATARGGKSGKPASLGVPYLRE